jgi:conjugal transfer/entry exclusion protein
MQSLISKTNNISHSRKATVTVNVLEEYKDIITNTTSKLEKHLQEIDNKLQPFSLQGTRTSDKDRAERTQLREKTDSTKQCLRICAQVSEHINRVQPNTFEDISRAQDAHQVVAATLKDLISARRVTAQAGSTQ